MSKAAIQKLVTDHESWIQNTLSSKTRVYETQDFIRTGKLLYFGTYWPVNLIKTASKKGKVSFDEVRGFEIQATGDELQLRQLVEAFYREQASIYLNSLQMNMRHV